MKSHKRPLPKRSKLANLLFDRHLWHKLPQYILNKIDHLGKPIKIYQAELKFKVIPKGIPLLDNCWVRFAVWEWTRFPTSNLCFSFFGIQLHKQHIETSQKTQHIETIATKKNSCWLIIYHQPLNLRPQGTNQWVKSMAMEPLSIEICWWTWLKKLGIRVEGPRTKQQYQQTYNIKT